MKIKIALTAGILAIIMGFCFACRGSASDKPLIGTSDEPFIVDSPDSLLKIGTGKDGWDLDKHYKQTADIDMSGQSWTPIGAYEDGHSDKEKPFTGNFDGNGYIIKGLTTEDGGMFDCIGTGGIVKNVALVGGSVSGSKSYNASAVGGLANINDGTVQNCYSTGNVTGREQSAGGLVGANYGTVQNCYTTGNIGEKYYVGGVVGYNQGIVQNCYATGRISGIPSEAVGGVVGCNGNSDRMSGRVEGCVGLSPLITRIGYYTDHSINSFGRVVGWNWREASLYNNYARRGMRLPTDIRESVKNDVDDIHGADITSAQWNKADWWENTAEFPSNAWNFRNGLPTLKGVGGNQNPTVRQK